MRLEIKRRTINFIFNIKLRALKGQNHQILNFERFSSIAGALTIGQKKRPTF